MGISKTNCAIHWIVIHPVDGAIHLLNNPGQDRNQLYIIGVDPGNSETDGRGL